MRKIELDNQYTVSEATLLAVRELYPDIRSEPIHVAMNREDCWTLGLQLQHRLAYRTQTTGKTYIQVQSPFHTLLIEPVADCPPNTIYVEEEGP